MLGMALIHEALRQPNVNKVSSKQRVKNSLFKIFFSEYLSNKAGKRGMERCSCVLIIIGTASWKGIWKLMGKYFG